MSRRPVAAGADGGASGHVAKLRVLHGRGTTRADAERADDVRKLALEALGSGGGGLLHGMLSGVSDDLACLAELSFGRDSFVSAALTRIHERIEAVLKLAVLVGETQSAHPDDEAAE